MGRPRQRTGRVARLGGDKPGSPDVVAPRRRLATAIVLLAFTAIFVALGVHSFTQKSATWDEPIHLTAGYLSLAHGDYRVDPSHPPFLRMWAALPLLTIDGLSADTSEIDRTQSEAWLSKAYPFARRFLYRGQNADRVLDSARFMVLLWGVGLGILLFAWVREWLGFTYAALALAFYTIEPNIGAHARLVTTDFGATFFIFATVYCLWRACRRPSLWNVAGLTACFSLAFVTKFSAVLLVPIVVLLMAVAVGQRMRLRVGTCAALAALLIVSTVLVIWTVYGFHYAPSSSESWLLRLQDSPTVQARAPLLGEAVAFVDGLHVLPNAYTQGFLMSLASAQQTAYLGGSYSDVGWWYFFPAAFLMKTPSALTLLFAVGVVALVARRRQLGLSNVWFVVLPPAVYVGFAMASGVNIGLRHILPVYPFVLMIAASAAQALTAWRRPIGALVLAGVTAYWGVRYASVYPHLLTYFSLFVGGPENGLKYLADSNLDWGQDLKLLKDWMNRKGVGHVNLAYFGTADPQYYQIASTFLPGTTLTDHIARPRLPGYVAVSATVLAGVYLDERWRLFYSGLRNVEPVDRLGNSIYVYWVDRWPESDLWIEAAESPAGARVEASLADGLLFELDWPDHAILHYRRALARDPNNARVAGQLGVTLLNTGQARDAVPVFQRAAILEPRDRTTRYRLALALVGAGQTEAAVVQAEATVALSPNDPAAHDLLGLALAGVGRMGDARDSFERALQVEPGYEEAREHLRLLGHSVLRSADVRRQ